MRVAPASPSETSTACEIAVRCPDVVAIGDNAISLTFVNASRSFQLFEYAASTTLFDGNRRGFRGALLANNNTLLMADPSVVVSFGLLPSFYRSAAKGTASSKSGYNLEFRRVEVTERSVDGIGPDATNSLLVSCANGHSSFSERFSLSRSHYVLCAV